MSLETTTYLAGPGGVSLIWANGKTTFLPERSVVRLERRPRRIVGTLYPLRGGQPTYETRVIRRPSA